MIPAFPSPFRNARPSSGHGRPRRFLFPVIFAALLAHSAANWCGAAEPPDDSATAYRKATFELKLGLETKPDDAEARRKLGLIELEFGRGPAAEKELRKALELGTSPDVLQLPMMESLLIQGKYQEVLDEWVSKTALPKEQQSAMLAYRGEAWFGLNRSEAAEEEFKRALQLNPGNAAAKLGLARIAQNRQRYEEAGRLIAEVLARTRDDAKAWSAQGSLFEATGQFDKAEESYGKAIALRRFSPIERASRVLLRINADRFEAAREDLDILKREAPEFFLTLYTEGLLYLRTERYAEAQTSLERALRQNDRFNSTNYYLGLAHFYQGHDREAEHYLQTFAAYQPNIAEARVLLASLKLRAGDHEEARALLKTVLARQPDNRSALKLLSDVEILSGHQEKGLEYLRKYTQLARERRSHQDKARPLPPPPDAAELLAGLETEGEIDPKLARDASGAVLRHLRAGKFAEARTVADKLRAKAPDHPLADRLAGLIHLARNEPEQARAAFEAALAKKPGDPALTHRLAQLALKSKDPARARRLYEQALERDPRNFSLRMHLAELDGQEGRFRDMQERLEGIVRDYPTELGPRMVLASQLLKAGQAGRAQAVLEEIRDGYPRNPALSTLLIKAQLDNHQAKQALATAQAFAADDPQSGMAHYLLASAYAANRKLPEARQALEKAMSVERGFQPARHSYIRMLAGQGDFERANREMQALAGDYPNDVEVMLLRVWVALAERKPGEALKAADAAWNKAKSTETVTAYAKARWQAGGRAGAIELLETWLGAHPSDALARIAAADFYTAQQSTDKAIGHLERVLKEHPDNTLVLNNLAWLYRKTDPGRALSAARRAASLSPHAPDVLDTLATIELERGDTAKAVEILSHAAELAPAQKPIRYHLAQALEKAGKRPEAAGILQDLLSDKHPFPERKDATALLEKLSAP